MKRYLLPAVLIACCVSFAVSQEPQATAVKPAVPYSTENEIKADVELVPCENRDRLEGVRNLFISKGAAGSDIRIEDFGHVENLVIEKKGKTGETVIIGAHYDEAGGGCGAIDNWTGIVIIANLYKTIRALETVKTYKFVAFGKEEEGLIGSRAMAGEIPKDKRESYCAMVNLDSFGQSYPQFMRNVSDERLIKLGLETAETLKMPTAKASILGASSDSAAFIEKSIPAISIHGLSNNWEKYLHTSNDKVKNVNIVSVYYGYRFTLSFIAAIEAKPCNAFRKTAKK